MSLQNFIRELKRRNVFRAAITYIAVGWVVLQAGSVVFPLLSISDAYLRSLLFILIIGFPVWIVFAWIYEYTGEGFRKTDERELVEEVSRGTGKRMNAIIILSLTLAVILLLADRWHPFTGKSDDDRIAMNIAILPFAEATKSAKLGDLSNAFAFGIHNNLARLSNLSLIPFNDVVTGRSGYDNNRHFADKFNIRYYLSGVVSVQGTDTLINVELIDIQMPNALWSDYFVARNSDFFKIIVSICLDVIENLKVDVPVYELELLKKKPTTSEMAFLLLSKAVKNSQSRIAEDLNESGDLLLQAIAEDDQFGLAYAELANIRFAQGWISSDKDVKDSYFHQSDSLAGLAVEIDDRVFTAHSVIATHKELVENDISGARTKFQEAIEIHPNDATALRHYSLFLKRNRDYQNSLSSAKQAYEKNPVSRITNRNYIDILLWNERHADAKKQLDLYVDQFPKDSSTVYKYFGDYYTMTGDFEEAINYYEKHYERYKTVAGELGYCYARVGDEKRALDMVRSVPRNHRYTEANLAMIYVGLSSIHDAYQDSTHHYIVKAIELNKGVNVVCDHPFFSGVSAAFCNR